MKKQRSQKPATHKPKPSKHNNDIKYSIPPKKHHNHKKQADSHKENKSLLQDAPLLIKPTKKTNVKSKERSKSLIYDRKAMEASTQSSHRQALIEILQKKIEKADTDISAHLNSVKHDKHIIDIDKIHSHFLSPHHYHPQLQESESYKSQNETTPKLKQLQDENETLRTNLSAIKQEMSACRKQHQAAKCQNAALKQRISDFQCEAEAQISLLKEKEGKMLCDHRAEREKLQREVSSLQVQQNRLLEEKQALESLVRNQQQNILILEQEKVELQAQCQAERKEKATLKRDKEEAAMRIQCLEQQLSLFQSNLREFQQIKETYEEKLMLLEKEKQKIKRNAFQLLEMVQNYREC